MNISSECVRLNCSEWTTVLWLVRKLLDRKRLFDSKQDYMQNVCKLQYNDC